MPTDSILIAHKSQERGNLGRYEDDEEWHLQFVKRRPSGAVRLIYTHTHRDGMKVTGGTTKTYEVSVGELIAWFKNNGDVPTTL